MKEEQKNNDSGFRRASVHLLSPIRLELLSHASGAARVNAFAPTPRLTVCEFIDGASGVASAVELAGDCFFQRFADDRFVELVEFRLSQPSHVLMERPRRNVGELLGAYGADISP